MSSQIKQSRLIEFGRHFVFTIGKPDFEGIPIPSVQCYIEGNLLLIRIKKKMFWELSCRNVTFCLL